MINDFDENVRSLAQSELDYAISGTIRRMSEKRYSELKCKLTGGGGLTDEERLELLLLCTGAPTESFVYLMEEYGCAQRVYEQSADCLVRKPYLSDKSALAIALCGGTQPAGFAVTEDDSCQTTSLTANFLERYYRGVSGESFILVYLDKMLKPIDITVLCRCAPMINGDILTVIKNELPRKQCRAAVLAHNITGSPVKATAADAEITARIGTFLAAYGVQLIDHMIIGEKRTVSMRRTGYHALFA